MTYLIVYIGSVLLALLFTPTVIAVARSLNIYDDLHVRKVHAEAVPRIGGVAIVSAMLGGLIPVFWSKDIVSGVLGEMDLQLCVLLGAGIFIFAVGLIDDVHHLRVRTKFFAQLLGATVLCSVGVRIESIRLLDWFEIDFGWFAWFITIIWIVGITNAVNLIDGLDGLAAGISGITCGVIAIFSVYCGQPLMAILMLALLGGLTGFLFFNFNPARIFMGDCGSLFLGFMLAGASVMCAAKSSTIVGLAIPCLALGIPIFDTLFSMLRRFLERRSMFSADRGHFHHRLLDMGIHHRDVVVLIYLLTFLMAGLGMFMMATRDMATVIIFGCVLILHFLVFRFVGAIRLQEALTNIRHKRSIALRAKGHQRDFEEAQLLLRRAMTFEQWWHAVQEAGKELGFAWMVLPQKARDGSERTLLWRRPDLAEVTHELFETTLPVRQRRVNDKLRISLAVEVEGLLETVGHRVALFSRLIDEHSPADLPPEVVEIERQGGECYRGIMDNIVELPSDSQEKRRETGKVMT